MSDVKQLQEWAEWMRLVISRQWPSDIPLEVVDDFISKVHREPGEGFPRDVKFDILCMLQRVANAIKTSYRSSVKADAQNSCRFR